MLAKDSPYKHVFFRINQSIYGWGKGYLISNEAINEWEKEVIQILCLLKLVLKPKNIYGACHEGLSELGESLYMHPMDFSGYIHTDNIKRFEEVIKNFNSKYWRYDRTNIYNMSDAPNEYGSLRRIDDNLKEYHTIPKNPEDDAC